MISPQGYSLGEEPKAKNPFWNGSGEDSDVNRIYATAEVQGTTEDGAPSVETNKTTSGHDITFGFLFKNIIGKNGVSPTVTVTDITGGHRVSITDATSTHTFDIMNGEKGDAGASPDVSVREIVGGHIVTITDATGSESFTVMNGTQGEKGDDGDTPVITITATQDGEPVQVTKTGTDAAPNFNIALKGGGGGGASGYMTFGGKSGLEYEPRLEEGVDKTDSVFSYNVNISNSIEYYFGANLVNDTINVNGTINLPADTVMRTVRYYFLGGYKPVDSDTYSAHIPLDASDFTVTLTSGNTLTVESISITDIHNGSEPTGMGKINVEGNVTNGTDSDFLVGELSAGITSISGKSEFHTYHLEPKSEA